MVISQNQLYNDKTHQQFAMAKRTVLITGCSAGGIGAAMTKAFSDLDYHVFATLRDTVKAGPLTQMANLEILQLEVTSREPIEQCVLEVQKWLGKLPNLLIAVFLNVHPCASTPSPALMG